MTREHRYLQTSLQLALLASLASLAIAFIAQYIFGLKPCELCLLQRIPYAVVMGLAFLGLCMPRIGQNFLLFIGVLFLMGAGIASYHAAVEKQWVKGPSACTDTETQAVQTLDGFLKKMQAAPIVACDQPQWDFHGLTMAGMNGLWSLALALAVFAALQQLRRMEKGDA